MREFFIIAMAGMLAGAMVAVLTAIFLNPFNLVGVGAGIAGAAGSLLFLVMVFLLFRLLKMHSK